jgi:hypothetical protein
MSQIKINVDGKERTITTLGTLDMGNPVTAQLLECMCRKADEAKQKPASKIQKGDIVRIPSGKPLTGRNFEIAKESFEEYFSDDWEEDDLEE